MQVCVRINFKLTQIELYDSAGGCEEKVILAAMRLGTAVASECGGDQFEVRPWPCSCRVEPPCGSDSSGRETAPVRWVNAGEPADGVM